MQKSITLLLGIWAIFTTSYAQFTDSFTDLDFTINPTWSGDQADYEVTLGMELHLNAPAVSATKYLSTPSTAIDNANWEFTSRIDVNPSGSNYTDIYLVSSSADLSGSLNGYFVRVGGTTDEVSLFKQTGTTQTEIIDGIDDLVDVSMPNVKVQVTRTATGDWELLADTTSGFTGYVSQGTITDNDFLTSAYFGVSCIFTSTRSDVFYFDDFVVTGTAPVDNFPPTIDEVTVTSNTTLDVLFSEAVDLTTSQTLTNYSADNSIGNPTVATRDAGNTALVHLTFGSAFQPNVYNTLTVTGVEDLAGNAISNLTEQFIYIVPATPAYRDVVINEVHPDPTPVVGLPEEEFIELYNASNKAFDLDGWTISDGGSTGTLTSYILLPGEHVILASDNNIGAFAFYTKKLGVAGFPGLTNSGEDLFLRDTGNNMIDYMNYNSSFYAGTDKGDGGWTLELINPLLPCFNPSNWAPSTNGLGGTPGEENSIYDTTADQTPPSLVEVTVLSDSTIKLWFSEGLDPSNLSNNSFAISNGRSVSSYTLSNNNDAITCEIVPVLDTAVIYTITIDSLYDCSGNLGSSSQTFVLANAPDSGDLILNEILFNPYTGGFDFVEVYNNSNKFIDIFGWSISNDSLYADSIVDHKVLRPGDYLVLTESETNIRAEYITHSPSSFLEIDDLPSFNNDEGEAFLFYGIGKLSDHFAYDEDMHFPLLKDVDGVSLERLDFNRPTNEEGNWHSAAENIGFATPGLENSQVKSIDISGAELDVTPQIFSPDNDGFEDILSITYKLDKPGYVGSLVIYDANGRLVRTLVKSQTLASEGVFSWDGTSDDFTKARIGTYILFFEIFNESGEIKSIKKTCVVAHKL